MRKIIILSAATLILSSCGISNEKNNHSVRSNAYIE